MTTSTRRLDPYKISFHCAMRSVTGLDFSKMNQRCVTAQKEARLPAKREDGLFCSAEVQGGRAGTTVETAQCGREGTQMKEEAKKVIRREIKPEITHKWTAIHSTESAGVL